MPFRPCRFLHGLTSVEINTDNGFTAFLGFVVEGLGNSDLCFGFQEAGEVADVVFLYGFVGQIRAAFVGGRKLFLQQVFADVEAAFAPEVFDDFHFIVSARVERYLFIVLHEEQAGDFAAVREGCQRCAGACHRNSL